MKLKSEQGQASFEYLIMLALVVVLLFAFKSCFGFKKHKDGTEHFHINCPENNYGNCKKF